MQFSFIKLHFLSILIRNKIAKFDYPFYYHAESLQLASKCSFHGLRSHFSCSIIYFQGRHWRLLKWFLMRIVISLFSLDLLILEDPLLVCLVCALPYSKVFAFSTEFSICGMILDFRVSPRYDICEILAQICRPCGSQPVFSSYLPSAIVSIRARFYIVGSVFLV